MYKLCQLRKSDLKTLGLNWGIIQANNDDDKQAMLGKRHKSEQLKNKCCYYFGVLFYNFKFIELNLMLTSDAE